MLNSAWTLRKNTAEVPLEQAKRATKDWMNNQRLKSIVLEQIRFREQTNQWISQRRFDIEFPGPELYHKI